MARAPLLGLAEQLDPALRIAAPGHRHPERGGGVDLLFAGHRLAGAGDPDRLLRQALPLGEDAVEHPEPGQRGEHLGTLGARLPRDELDRPASRQDRAGRVAGGTSHVGQPLVQQPESDPIPARIQAGGGRLQVGRGSRRPPDRVGRLGGTDLELGDVGRGTRRPSGGAPPGDLGGAVDGQGELEGRQLVGRGMPLGRLRRGLDRRVARPLRLVGVQPVASGSRRPGRRARWPGRPGGASAASAAGRARRLARSTRGGRRARRRARRRSRAPGPRSAPRAGRHPGRRRRGAERCSSGAPIARSRPRRRRRRRPAGASSSGGRPAPAGAARGGTPASGRRSAPSPGRRTSRSATPSGARAGPPAAPRPRAGCRRSARRPGAAGWRRHARPRSPRSARRDRRDPAAARARRSTGSGRRRDRGEIVGPRMVARHDVGLVGHHDRQPLVARDADQEGDQGSGRGIGAMQVLEDQRDGPALAESTEDAEDPFEGARLAALGGRRRPATGRIVGDAGREVRQQAHELAERRGPGSRAARDRAGRAGRARSPG